MIKHTHTIIKNINIDQTKTIILTNTDYFKALKLTDIIIKKLIISNIDQYDNFIIDQTLILTNNNFKKY